MRKLAGRPTSEDIDKIRVEKLLAEEAALKASLDSQKVEKIYNNFKVIL